MLFDGVDDQVTRPAVVTGTAWVAYQAWMRPTSMGASNVGGIFAHGERPRFGFNGSAGSNKLRFKWEFSGTDGQWDLATALVLGDWTHVLVLYNKATPTVPPLFYRNGVLDTTTTIAAPTGNVQDSPSLSVGGQGAADAWAGDLGAFAPWFGRAMTADDVALVYHYGPLASPAGLFLHWKLDVVSAGLALDDAGEDRHGTVLGAVDGEPHPDPSIFGHAVYVN